MNKEYMHIKSQDIRNYEQEASDMHEAAAIMIDSLTRLGYYGEDSSLVPHNTELYYQVTQLITARH